EKNDSQSDGIMEIQKEDSPCKILVVSTDEEFEIAKQTLDLIG
ncbi:MAG TPA: acetate kinase, partial [Desulfocapsa sulfexigens]|nr:acetate kinase [Desulfocapsa sulfexigens]